MAHSVFNSGNCDCNSFLYWYSKDAYFHTCREKRSCIQVRTNTTGDCDTDVIFTDIETGETYTVGYITSGVSEKIKLQKGKWYTVEGAGNITVSPVNIRIE